MSVESDVWWLDEHHVVSLRELVEVSGLREPELLDLVQSGALPARHAADGRLEFTARVVTLARTACRLRNDFELDTRGLAIALRLLERVHDLEGEIRRLRALLPGA